MSSNGNFRPEALAFDAEELAHTYQVGFRTNIDRYEERLLETSGKMQAAAKSYQADFEMVDLDGKDIYYLKPPAVLQSPLTPAQKQKINEGETSKVADYTTDIQRQLESVPIVESREPLAYLPELLQAVGASATYSDIPFHAACGEWAGKPRHFWAREEFAERLAFFGLIANEAGLQLHFEDAFRPAGVQEGLFRRRVAWTRRDYPDWPYERVIEEAKSKTAVKPRLASHMGGAAIDARLQDADNGTFLDIGHDYPDGGAIVFPRTPFVTGWQWANRQLFSIGCQLSGLTLYVGEDWHASFGDNLASINHAGAIDPAYQAKYGPIKKVKYEDGKGQILEVYHEQELDHIFDI